MKALPDSEELPCSEKLLFEPPELPPIVAYEDEFTGKRHSAVPADDQWELWSSGKRLYCYFQQQGRDDGLVALLKAFAATTLLEMVSSTVHQYIWHINRFSVTELLSVLNARPLQAKQAWLLLLAAKNDATAYAALKALLKFCATLRLGEWSPSDISFIEIALPGLTTDKYSSLRSGDVFLTLQEESRLVTWIDTQTSNAGSLSTTDLADAGMIAAAYQFGMRPKQIGMVRQKEVSIRVSGDDGSLIVHLTFSMIKQRDKRLKKFPLVRKVKREWSPLFAMLAERLKGESDDTRLFGVDAAYKVAVRISGKLSEILGRDRTTYDLRHSAAQPRGWWMPEQTQTNWLHFLGILRQRRA